MPLREAEQSIFLILRDAATNLHFFDLPDGKKLVWLLQRALHVGAEMSRQRPRITRTRAVLESKQAARRVLREAASEPHFFDFSDAERLVWMLERAFVLGAGRSSPRAAEKCTKTKGAQRKSNRRTHAKNRR